MYCYLIINSDIKIKTKLTDKQENAVALLLCESRVTHSLKYTHHKHDVYSRSPQTVDVVEKS